MTKQQLLDSLAEMLKAAPSATVAIPGFSGQPAARPAVKTNGDAPATIVESTPFRRVRYSGRPSKAQIADLKGMGAFAHRVVEADGSQTWYWLVPTASN